MKEKEYSLFFPEGGETQALQYASALIHVFTEQGLMLDITPETLTALATNHKLVLAMSGEEVVGTAALTFAYPDGRQEFGGWSVKEEWQKHGVGLALLAALADGLGGDKIIAFGNANSGPIFEKLGAVKLVHADLHESAFEPCKTCSCKGKQALAEGQKCVDTIYDLTPIILAMAGEEGK